LITAATKLLRMVATRHGVLDVLETNRADNGNGDEDDSDMEFGSDSPTSKRQRSNVASYDETVEEDDEQEDDEQGAKSFALTTIKYSFAGEDMSPDHLTAIRLQVIQQLQGTAHGVQLFDAATARGVAEYFFSSVFSITAARRVAKFVEYINRGSTELQGGADIIFAAQEAAANTQYPQAARDFFSSYADVEKDMMLDNAMYKATRTNMNLYRLYSRYERMISLARDNKGGVRRLLNNHGITTATGVGWASCVRDITKQILGINTSILNNRVQDGLFIHGLAEIWGKGIMLLLPPEFRSR